MLLFGRPSHTVALRGHRPTLSFFFFNKSVEASTLFSSVPSNRAAAQRESLCFSCFFCQLKQDLKLDPAIFLPRKTPQKLNKLICAEFACFPCDCVGSLRVLRLAPTIQRHANVRLIGYSKLSMGVIVSLNGCLSLYGWIQWRLSFNKYFAQNYSAATENSTPDTVDNSEQLLSAQMSALE